MRAPSIKTGITDVATKHSRNFDGYEIFKVIDPMAAFVVRGRHCTQRPAN